MIVEIAANNISSAIAAWQGGAHSIELCDNLSEGGTTPSYATTQYCVNHLPIPVFPIIRPRGGNFVYSQIELDIMLADIEICKTLGCAGVVIGVLDEKGNVNKKENEKLIKAAGAMQVSFHRAFDRTNDAHKALQDVIELGCTRLLTSGQHANAYEGRFLLKDLIEAANDKIIIMPGAGIDATNAKEIIQFTHCKEIHTSMKSIASNTAVYQNKNLGLDSFIETAKEKVQEFIQSLQ